MSAEIIDQANELAERRLEMTIRTCASTMRQFQPLTAATVGKRYPSGAGNLWRAASAALTVRKKRNYAVSIGGDKCRQLSRSSQMNGFQRTC